MPNVLPFPPPAIISVLPYYLSKAPSLFNPIPPCPDPRKAAAIATESAPAPAHFRPGTIMAGTLALLSMVSPPVSMARRGALWGPGGTMVAV